MTKAHVRLRVLRQLRQQEEDERARKSQVVWRKVRRLPAFRQAKVVCCYVALPYEVQTWGMIEEMLAGGKRVVVPVVDARRHALQLSEVRDLTTDLAPGAFGVWEPRPRCRRFIPPSAVDLVMVPGLAFDRRGHRVGHGYGYFDRLLARLPAAVPTVGLAFRFQLLDHLPTLPHDYAVQRVLTA